MEIDKFKFIYGKNLTHKAVIKMNVKLCDKTVIEFKTFDDIADKILRNEFKFVYICGQIKSEGYVQIKEIEEVY